MRPPIRLSHTAVLPEHAASREMPHYRQRRLLRACCGEAYDGSGSALRCGLNDEESCRGSLRGMRRGDGSARTHTHTHHHSSG